MKKLLYLLLLLNYCPSFGQANNDYIQNQTSTTQQAGFSINGISHITQGLGIGIQGTATDSYLHVQAGDSFVKIRNLGMAGGYSTSAFGAEIGMEYAGYYPPGNDGSNYPFGLFSDNSGNFVIQKKGYNGNINSPVLISDGFTATIPRLRLSWEGTTGYQAYNNPILTFGMENASQTGLGLGAPGVMAVVSKGNDRMFIGDRVVITGVTNGGGELSSIDNYVDLFQVKGSANFTSAVTSPGFIVSAGNSITSVGTNDIGISTNGALRGRFTSAGNFLMNTTIDDGVNLMQIAGVIRSKAIKIDANGWSDFVFASGYKLPALGDVERYVNRHHHLEGVPSEKEVMKNGIDVAGVDAVLLKKIEELTLYLIQKDKEISELQERQKHDVRQLNLKIKRLESNQKNQQKK